MQSLIAWSSNEIYSQHFFNEALSLPNLSSPVLNRILVEGMRMAAEICEAQHTWITNTAAGMLLRIEADEMEKNT